MKAYGRRVIITRFFETSILNVVWTVPFVNRPYYPIKCESKRNPPKYVIAVANITDPQSVVHMKPIYKLSQTK